MALDGAAVYRPQVEGSDDCSCFGDLAMLRGTMQCMRPEPAVGPHDLTTAGKDLTTAGKDLT
eukprot:1159308-Pelagomonas_calceolata.AAC.8